MFYHRANLSNLPIYYANVITSLRVDDTYVSVTQAINGSHDGLVTTQRKVIN